MDEEKTIINNDELNEAQDNYMRHMLENPNNLSFWFPKVKDHGIAVPETHIIPVPKNIMDAFFLERKEDRELISGFVDKEVMPVVNGLKTLPFIKNGCFSNKFEFNTCCPADKDPETIKRCVTEIQYGSLCLDTMGNSEIVVRERIPSPPDMPTIYGGLPLNTEFRVFYDFDHKTPLYVANYWDKGYCLEAISRHEPDRKAYMTRYPSLEADYRASALDVLIRVGEAMREVEGLEGAWSVDILKDSEGKFWLIDMALAKMSAYWDETRAVLPLLFRQTDSIIRRLHTRGPAWMDGTAWRESLKGYVTSVDDSYKGKLMSALADIRRQERGGKAISVADMVKEYTEGVMDGERRRLEDIRETLKRHQGLMDNSWLEAEERRIWDRLCLKTVIEFIKEHKEES